MPSLNLSISNTVQRFLTLVCCAGVLFLAGCATPPPTVSSSWLQHQQQLEQLDKYQAKGKLGYVGEQRFSSTLVWQSEPNYSSLLLTNLFGKTLLKLQTTPQLTKLTDIDGNEHRGNDPARLVKQLTNINLPINQMQDWLLGLPTAADDYQLNSQNHLASLNKRIDNQLWHLEYLDYDYTTTPALPKKMVLRQDNIKITLVISQWSLQ